MNDNSGDTVMKAVQLRNLTNKYAFFIPKTCTFPHYQSFPYEHLDTSQNYHTQKVQTK